MKPNLDVGSDTQLYQQEARSTSCTIGAHIGASRSCNSAVWRRAIGHERKARVHLLEKVEASEVFVIHCLGHGRALWFENVAFRDIYGCRLDLMIRGK